MTIACRIKGYIQPFERCLALDELRALTACEPTPQRGNIYTASVFWITGAADAGGLQRDLAYWEAVGPGRGNLTTQLRCEATSVIARNGVALEDLPGTVSGLIEAKLPNKRCLRYASHGLHEYRGKFFPQLVRALLNIAKVPSDGIVLDPMCGSGTTLVEGVLSGRPTHGLDMNPLSVFVSDTKCRALHLRPKALISAFTDLSERLGRPITKSPPTSYLESLPARDQDYLRNWFSENTLAELDQITSAVSDLPETALRDVFSLCLSNILRSVSWQKDDDLRIRKDITPLAKGEVITRFLDEALRSTKTLVAFIVERGRCGLGPHWVAEGDARSASQTRDSLAGRVDVILTSPPYATALPYLDTDRLSLIYLGLLQREDHRARDMLMIGNREITERTRERYWEIYLKVKDRLPAQTRRLVEKIDRLNSGNTVGFRRRNLAALLSKYFFDMRAVMEHQLLLLRPGGTMFMVIGNNRTTAGGEAVEIRTGEHLAAMAEMIGFKVSNWLNMDMLVSRDIFRKNAMPSEQIMTMVKRQ